MKLIDKESVVHFIKDRLGKNEEKQSLPQFFGMVEEDLNILSFLETLETKDINMDDTKKEEMSQEYIGYTFKRHNIDADSKGGQLIYHAYMHGINHCLNELRKIKDE
jgi:hypothetical protein